MTNEELIKRLRKAVVSGHLRNCQGRRYICDCGYDDTVQGLLELAADELDRLPKGGLSEEQIAEAAFRVTMGK